MTKGWSYRIVYPQPLTAKAPFGHEQVMVRRADDVDNEGIYLNGSAYSRYISSYVLQSGTKLKDGTFNLHNS